MSKIHIFLFLIITFFTACQKEQQSAESIAKNTLFSTMPTEVTGIDFVNQLDYDADFNIYTYRNFYNGGGVAIGDINNDDLPDIYFTANQKANKLYLNKGNFQFEDISQKAGVNGEKGWSTGVSMADVNGDGWLDIYICNSGNVEGDDKENELYINNQDGTFTEKAAQYGLADKGYSTHAAFFDYDKDGDLDVYLLNNSYQAIGSFNLQKNMRPIRDEQGGDKLLRNDGETFTDVSVEAGIYGSVIGFGLGVTVGDIDRDGWQDIYVSNDFFERDYIYMNNGDGTFREELTKQMNSISGASMGADMADINGDGYPEIFVTEMLPEDDPRFKTTMTFENWDKYQYNLENDYYHQFTRNMLQLNNGDGTFSEIGRLANVEATDWSWGALIADFDNDGHRDIFVSNGIHRDILDKDYLNYVANDEVKRAVISKEGVDFQKLIDIIPTTKIPNYAFQNNGHNLRFKNKATDWGLAEPSHSNGAAYADLDNDGDLDLVVNNINMQAFVYRNNSESENAYNWLKIKLIGKDKNPFGIGAKVMVQTEKGAHHLEQMPMRGFESTVDYVMHFGLGEAEKIDLLTITWPDGNRTTAENVTTNQTLTFQQKDAEKRAVLNPEIDGKPIFRQGELAVAQHKENRFVDFDRDRLLFHMISGDGPKISVADVNNDGRTDLFLSGSKGQPSQLLVDVLSTGPFAGPPPGGFKAVMPSNKDVFEENKTSEDLDSDFFDADGDGDLDLYVVTGGNEFPSSSSALRDRFYRNDGRGNFTLDKKAFKGMPFAANSCIDVADYDKDGDLDVFVGMRLRSFLYGVPVNGMLWQNDGKGNFKNVTKTTAPELEKIGMITDAIFSDYDGDGDEDLLLTAEWSPIQVFENQDGTFKKVTEQTGIANQLGWWNCIQVGDFNADGKPDYIVGNHGLNSRFQANKEEPINLYINDYDQNGTVEQILTQYFPDGEAYPFLLRHDLVMQMPKLKKKYLKYEAFKGQKMTDIFTEKELERVVNLQANFLESAVLMNKGNGTFELTALPERAQFAPIYAILIEDFNKDGKQDVLLGGNFDYAKPEVGRYDASYGLYLEGKGDGTFTAKTAKQSGFQVKGQIRDFAKIDNNTVLVARNNDSVVMFSWR